MKFGKVLQQQGEELPEKQFLRYKELKKLLKVIKSSDPSQRKEGEDYTDAPAKLPKAEGAECEDSALTNCRPGVLSSQEVQFIKTLNEELSSLNSFFMDEEEVIVMRLHVLESELDKAQNSGNNAEEIQKLTQAFIDFHGEIVMLLHWGHVNYVAVAKILKKHDKQTGLPLHAPCIEAVLRQPFYSTELLQRLAKRVGSIVDNLISQPSLSDLENEDIDLGEEAKQEPTDDAPQVDRMRQTHMAIGMWRELNENASTPSTILPVTHPLPDALKAQQEPAASVGPRRLKLADQNERTASEKTVESNNRDARQNKRKRSDDDSRHESGGDACRRRVGS